MNKKIYKYVYPKQTLFKKPDDTFYVKNSFGNKFEMNFRETVIYILLDEESNIESIVYKANKNINGLDMNVEEAEGLINEFLKKQLIMVTTTNAQNNLLHRHYSFDYVNLIGRLEEPVSKDTILTLGKLEMSMTYLCPFNCSYCSKKENIAMDNGLALEEMKKVLDESRILGATTISLTGGEPLYPKVVDKTLELIEYSKSVGFKRRMILTSGVGIEENFERIKNSSLTEIQISYNMAYIEEEDKVRNRFIENNIVTISKLRDFNMHVGICFVLSKESVHNIDSVIKFGIENNISSIYFYPVMPVGNAKDNWDFLKLTPIEIKNVVDKIRLYSLKYKEKIFLSMPQSFMFDDNIEMGCEAGNHMVYISEDGYVTGCACSKNSIDNVKNSSFIDIWQKSEYFEQFRNNSYDKLCSSCKDKKYCVNNCAIRQEYAKKGISYGNCSCEKFIS